MILKRARQLLEKEAQAILNVAGKLDADFERAVDLLYHCKGRVVVTGMGKSGLICKKIAATLASTGTPSFFLHPAEAMHGDLGMVVRGDVILAASYSGESEEINRLLPTFKRFGLKLICLTANTKSTLAAYSDIVLDIGVRQEACPLNLAPTTSTTVTLALGDALAISLLDRRGFREEDFAVFHPGGSLGRRLLKVADLVHVKTQLPVVREDAPMKEALLEISSKGLGVTSVVDEQGVLVGVFTDGDLRRLVVKDVSLLEQPVKNSMSRNPKLIGEEALAERAVQIMERYNITSLFVVDEQGRPAGVVHLHDLLKAGVV